MARQIKVTRLQAELARAKVEAEMQEKTQSLTAGLPIPPGMKLPF